MDFLSAYKSTINPNKEEDDEFGEFTSAAPFSIQPSANNVPTGYSNHVANYTPSNELPSFIKLPAVANGEPRLPTEEDEFGDFCGPVHIQSAPSLIFQSPPPVQKPNYELDLSVDEFSPQLPWSAREGPTVMQNPIFTPNDEDFGDFTTAEVLPEPSEIQTVSSRDDVLVPETSLPESLPLSREGDAFGDFVATEPVEVRTAADNADSLFHEQKESLFSFDELPVPVVPVVYEASGIAEDSKGSDSTLDSYDDFGEFTQASLPSLHFEEVAVEPAASVTTDIPVPSQDDGFRDFSSVTKPEAAAQSQEEFGDFTAVVDSTTAPLDVPQHTEDDDFGDFTTVTEVGTAAAAAEPASQNEDDEDFGDFAEADTDAIDEFTDFETAAPESSTTEMTAESIVHQVLSVIFPLERPLDEGKSPPSLLQCCSTSRGALWSFLRDLDSTPALSFQWRSSSTHHKLLDTLRIDPKPMANLLMPKWSSPLSVTSSLLSPEAPTSSPGPIVPLNLDLDYFAAAESTTSKLTTKSTLVNPVASLEKELLGSPLNSSISSPGFFEGLDVLSPVKNNALPPRSSQSSSTGTAERLGDLLEEFSFSSTASSTSLAVHADVLDLLQ